MLVAFGTRFIFHVAWAFGYDFLCYNAHQTPRRDNLDFCPLEKHPCDVALADAAGDEKWLETLSRRRRVAKIKGNRIATVRSSVHERPCTLTA
jgi:hypothetical protein